MLVLLNGGTSQGFFYTEKDIAPLADACVTEWRTSPLDVLFGERLEAPLADACVTEWREQSSELFRIGHSRHSLMLVLLNGGVYESTPSSSSSGATR